MSARRVPLRDPQGDALFFSLSEPQKSQGIVLACDGSLVALAHPYANLTCKETHFQSEASGGSSSR